MPTAMLRKNAVHTASPLATESGVAGALESIAAARVQTAPFRHWLFRDILSSETSHALIALPIAPAEISDTYGKRDSHNDARRFFSPESQAHYPVMKTVAETFQNSKVARAIEKLCGVNLAGSYLRIEYCQDRDGFWLEPHMDIKEKHITLQVYLNTGRDAGTLGTDLYDQDKKPFSSAPSNVGDAMLFVPKEPQSWHGFEKRTIPDVRRSLIINYVTDDWRSRHELSFPDQRIS